MIYVKKVLHCFLVLILLIILLLFDHCLLIANHNFQMTMIDVLYLFYFSAMF